MTRWHTAGMMIGVLLCYSLVWAEQQLGVGDRVPAVAGEDQHGEKFAVNSSVRVLLLSFDMASGKEANRYLAQQGADYLDRHKAVYVANIYGMPAIGKFFALRKMRSYPHRIVLSEQEHALDALPRESGAVTVVRINDARRVTSLDFWRPGEQPLQQFLE